MEAKPKRQLSEKQLEALKKGREMRRVHRMANEEARSIKKKRNTKQKTS